ncbi:MAG: methylated-DNA-[protein]-cysteine S-methyltransferase, partial [Luteibaculaceae bacterium]
FQGQDPLIAKTVVQLEEYFSGNQKIFELSVQFIGSFFQISVWEKLVQIPFGKQQFTSAYPNR